MLFLTFSHKISLHKTSHNFAQMGVIRCNIWAFMGTTLLNLREAKNGSIPVYMRVLGDFWAQKKG